MSERAPATLRKMTWKRPLSSNGARKLGARERAIGLDPQDEAARWLQEHGPAPEPTPPKAAGKSKELHRWRQRQARGDR